MFVRNHIFEILLLLSIFVTVSCDEAKTKTEESEDGTCHAQILETFQLDGIDSESPVDMTICQNVTAENNCCSVTDEIKAVKSWNYYSKPKLNLYVDDAINTIKRMFGLHSFVEKLNDMYIRFHYEDVKHIKVKEESCFEKETLLSMDNFKELVSESNAASEWFDAYAKNIITKILEYVSKQRSIDSVILAADIPNKIANKLYDNKKLLKQIKEIDDNFVFDEDLKHIIKIIEDIFVANGDSTAFKAVPDAKKPEVVKNTLDLEEYLRTLFLKDNIPKKNLKKIQEATYKGHIKNIDDFIMKNNAALFTTKSLKSDLRNEIVAKVVEALNKSDQLKMELNYFIHVRTLKGKESDKKINNLKGLMGDIIYKAITKNSKLSGAISTNIYNNFIVNFEKVFVLQDQLYKTMFKNYKVFVYHKMFTKIFRLLDKNNQKKSQELRKIFREKVLDEKFDGSLDITLLPFYEVASDDNYEEKYVENTLSLLDNIFSGTKIKIPESINYSAMYKAAIDSFLHIIDNVVFINNAKGGNQVCAVIHKTSLVKKIVFNKEKFKHCRTALVDLLNINVKEITRVIEEMKEEMKKMVELKKTAYCVICDKSLSKFIKKKNNSLIFSDTFCVDLVSRFSKYLEWKNITLIDYQNKLFQYLKCYLTDGESTEFPYKFFGKPQLESSEDFKGCISASGDEKVSACKKVCDDFNLFGYSKFFDGEREFIERMYNVTVNTLRMFGFMFDDMPGGPEEKSKDKKTSPETGDGRLLEDLTSNSLTTINKQNLIDGNEAHFDNNENYNTVSAFYNNKNDRILKRGRNINPKVKRGLKNKIKSLKIGFNNNRLLKSENKTKRHGIKTTDKNAGLRKIDKERIKGKHKGRKLIFQALKKRIKNLFRRRRAKKSKKKPKKKSAEQIRSEKALKKLKKLLPKSGSKEYKKMMNQIKKIKALISANEAKMSEIKKKNLETGLKTAKSDADYAEIEDEIKELKMKKEKAINKIVKLIGIKALDIKIKFPMEYMRKIQLIKSELIKDSKLRRKKRFIVKELVHPSINYEVMEPLFNMMKLQNKYTAKGINPFKLSQGANFDMGVTQNFIKSQPKKTNDKDEEEWDPQAVKVYVSIENKDIAMFNTDIAEIKVNPEVAKKKVKKTKKAKEKNVTKDENKTDKSHSEDKKDTRRLNTLRRRGKGTYLKPTRHLNKKKETPQKSKEKPKDITPKNSNRKTKTKSANPIKSFLMKLLF